MTKIRGSTDTIDWRQHPWTRTSTPITLPGNPDKPRLRYGKGTFETWKVSYQRLAFLAPEKDQQSSG